MSSTWSRAGCGHVIDEVFECCSNSDEGVIYRGVFLIGYTVVEGPCSASTQTSLVVADVECQNEQQTQHTHWACNHCSKGHGAQRLGLFFFCYNTQRRKQRDMSCLGPRHGRTRKTEEQQTGKNSQRLSCLCKAPRREESHQDFLWRHKRTKLCSSFLLSLESLSAVGFFLEVLPHSWTYSGPSEISESRY